VLAVWVGILGCFCGIGVGTGIGTLAVLIIGPVFMGLPDSQALGLAFACSVLLSALVGGCLGVRASYLWGRLRSCPALARDPHLRSARIWVGLSWLWLVGAVLFPLPESAHAAVGLLVFPIVILPAAYVALERCWQRNQRRLHAATAADEDSHGS
jgi:hypothetical protein